MATWKKVIVSGSNAELNQLNVGTNQQITTAQATTFLTGSFTGSFTGNGAGLTGVTATAIFPTIAVTNITTNDKFFISQSNGQEFITYGNLLTDLAGTNLTVEGSDSLTLASQIAVTGITASFTGSLTGALTGTASYATNALTASYANGGVVSANLTQGAGITAFTYNGGTAQTVAVSGASALSNNAVTKWNGSAFVNSSLTDNGTTVTGTTSVQLTGASSILTGSFTGSFGGAFTGALTGTASWATNATTAINANTASYVVTAQTASYVLNAVSSSFATSASYAASTNNITNAITNNADNRILTATGAGTINGESNLTFDGTTLTVTGNTTVTGNLTVAGTASFTNTDNLTIRDKFILINSGSSTLSDSGWITQYNAAGSGSAFYLDAGSANDHGPYGRFAVAFDVVGTSQTPTVSEYVVTAKINQASAPTTAVPPTWGTGSNGAGNMWVTTGGDIYIYS